GKTSPSRTSRLFALGRGNEYRIWRLSKPITMRSNRTSNWDPKPLPSSGLKLSSVECWVRLNLPKSFPRKELIFVRRSLRLKFGATRPLRWRQRGNPKRCEELELPKKDQGRKWLRPRSEYAAAARALGQSLGAGAGLLTIGRRQVQDAGGDRLEVPPPHRQGQPGGLLLAVRDRTRRS